MLPVIQKPIDKVKPMMTMMVPILVSLDPTAKDLFAWHSSVDTVMGKLEVNFGEIQAQLAKIVIKPLITSKAVCSPLSVVGHMSLAQLSAGGDDMLSRTELVHFDSLFLLFLCSIRSSMVLLVPWLAMGIIFVH